MQRFVYKAANGNPSDMEALWNMEDVFDFFWFVYHRQEEIRERVKKRKVDRGITEELEQ